MPVKHWGFAGLMLTYWCNASCASCYLACGPREKRGQERGQEPFDSSATADERDGAGPPRREKVPDPFSDDGTEEMSVEQALGYWAGLQAASPHGCRIHLSGGEPFGDWERLIAIARRAQREGLGPLEKVETNAYWATDEGLVRERLAALDAAGMGKLCISADPYHQQFVPIERCRLAARVAEELLGAERVQVRWRDWLAEGFDTGGLDAAARRELFAGSAACRRDRFNGRAADLLGDLGERKPMGEFADSPCAESLLRGRHVHIDGGGRVMPGTCAGIVLGRADRSSIAEIWRQLDADYAGRAVVGTLAAAGPVALLDAARAAGYRPRDSYASKCHLCWELRRSLAAAGGYEAELGPMRLYRRPQTARR